MEDHDSCSRFPALEGSPAVWLWMGQPTGAPTRGPGVLSGTGHPAASSALISRRGQAQATGVGGSRAVAVQGPPSIPLVPGKRWQGPAGTEACWTPVGRYGNSLPQEVIQLQVQTISQKVLAKFRGDRHDGTVRGQWDVASPGASEGGGHPCTRHPCPAHTAPILPQRTGLRTRESREAARGLPLGSPSTSFLPGRIPENIAEEGLCVMTIVR